MPRAGITELVLIIAPWFVSCQSRLPALLHRTVANSSDLYSVATDRLDDAIILHRWPSGDLARQQQNSGMALLTRRCSFDINQRPQ